MPISAILATVPVGKRSVISSSFASGFTSFSANSLKEAWSCTCSSLSLNIMIFLSNNSIEVNACSVFCF